MDSVPASRKSISEPSSSANERYSYDNSNIKADVAYDIFGGSNCSGTTGAHDYEVMIWMASYGELPPIGSKTAHVRYRGHQWDLFTGANLPNHINTVYTFVPTTGAIESFDGDLMPFLRYLGKKDGNFNTTLIQSIQAGTEAVTGSATFTTSSYSISGS